MKLSKINNGFCIVEHGPFIIAQLHNTKIAVLNRTQRRCKLYYGGWKTRTTKDAMNLFLNRVRTTIGQELYIYQHDFRWYISGPNTQKEFSEEGELSFTF